MEIVKSIQKLIEFNALHFDREKREVWVLREAFWDGKTAEWQANFAANLKMYIDIAWDADKHGPNILPVHIYSIDIDTKQRKDYITTFLPDTKQLSKL
jgi:hypothetical protein